MHKNHHVDSRRAYNAKLWPVRHKVLDARAGHEVPQLRAVVQRVALGEEEAEAAGAALRALAHDGRHALVLHGRDQRVGAVGAAAHAARVVCVEGAEVVDLSVQRGHSEAESTPQFTAADWPSLLGGPGCAPRCGGAP
eukprot:scaffold54632_cov60-Phaeocystis_antarctica.AAC.5